MSDELDELPVGWARTSLGYLGTWVGGGTPSKSNSSFWTKGTIPWVSPKDMKVDRITDSEDHITAEAIKRSSTQLIPEDSVLVVTRSGILQRILPVAVNQIPVTMNQDLKALLPSSLVTSGYCSNYLQSRSQQILRDCCKDGTTVASIDLQRLTDFTIWLAPLPEQRRIVAKIEALQARSRKAREALEAIPPLLEQFRQSVLAAAFRGDLTADWREQHQDVEPASVLLERIRAERRRKWEQAELAKFKAKGKKPNDDSWKEKYVEPEPVDDTDLPELPDGWCWTSIDTLTMNGPQNGIYVPRTQYGKGTPILRIDDYQIDWCRSSAELQQVDIDDTTAKIYGLRAGDVVVNRVNSPSHLGKSIIITESNIPAVFESNMMRLELFSQSAAFFCHFFLTSTLGKSLLTRNAKWAVNQASINQGDVAVTPIPLPPDDEQHAILDLIRKTQDWAKRASTNVTESESAFTQFDQSILAKAFRGELVLQDPSDEPASVLLERIRAERADDTNGKPLRGRSKRSIKTTS